MTFTVRAVVLRCLQLRAGVPLACVTVSNNLLDVAAAPLLELCQARGIKVFAAGALAHGLISEAFLGVAAPNTATAAAGAGTAAAGASTAGGSMGAAEALGPDNLAAGLQAVAR
jgi:aryl-alcohol dehydrogenase-like predicted oxidoreductase